MYSSLFNKTSTDINKELANNRFFIKTKRLECI